MHSRRSCLMLCVMPKLFGRTLQAAALPIAAESPVLQVASPWADNSNLEHVTLAGLFDALDSLPLTRSDAVKLPAAARGRDLICISCGRLPLVAVTKDGRLSTQPGFLMQPERGRPRSVTMTWTIDDLLWHGVAYWRIIERNLTDSRPLRFEWLPHSLCQLDSTGELISFRNEPIDRPDDIVRFDGPHEGVLSRGNKVFRDARRMAASFSRQADNPVPTVELHQTAGEAMKQDEIDAMIAQWSAARTTTGGGVGYTNQSVELRVHGVPAEQLLISGLDRCDLDIARHMGLPAWAVDANVSGSNLTYSTVPARARELIDYTLEGYLSAVADRLSLDDILPRGTWAQFVTDPLTDGSFGERMADAKAAIDAGIFTADQMKNREAGIPLEGAQQ